MNTVLLVVLILEAIFGLGFTLAPGFMLAPFGVTLDATATTVARMFGSALLGLTVLVWFTRRSKQREFRQGTAYSLVVYYVISAVIMLMAVINRQVNSLGWIIVALHTGLAVWLAYLLFR